MGKGGPNILTKGIESVKGIFRPNPNSVSPESDDIGDKVTNLGNKKKQKIKGVIPIPVDTFFTGPEDEKTIKNCPLLKLPMRERIIIWKTVNLKTLHALRSTCSRIKSDIDHFVGLFGVVDDKHLPSFELFKKTGLQSVRVINLTSESEFTRFLLHPLLLKHLCISGEISSAYFAYITEYCPFITTLRIHFSSQAISSRIYFFPILSQHWATERTFEHLKDINLDAITKKNRDLRYISDNVAALLTEDLSLKPGLRRLKVCFTHKSYDPEHMRVIHETVSACVNCSSETITHVLVELKDTHIDDGHETRTDFLGRVLRRGSADWSEIKDRLGGLNPVTVMPMPAGESDEPFPAQIEPEPEPEPEEPTIPDIQIWKPFPKLIKVYLSVNGEYCEYWKYAFLKTSSLTHLFLELNTNDNWEIYSSLIEASALTLKHVDCYEITRNHEEKKPPQTYTSIDAGVFNKCKNLYRLSLNFCTDEDGVRYKLINLGRLPRYILYLQFAWVILDPCDLTKMALFHRRLLHLNIAYWSSSAENFKKFWCRFRWIFCLHLTSLTRLVVTDSKIRYQNQQLDVYKFLYAHDKFCSYFDTAQTVLIFDRKPKQVKPVKTTSVSVSLGKFGS